MAYGPVNIPGINETAKGVPNGVASLDANGKVPSEQLPEMDYIPSSQKGSANGVASLDDSGKVPSNQLPEMDYDNAGSAAAVQANLDKHSANANNPHDVTAAQVGAIPETAKGAPNGVAQLDASGKVPSAQLPALGGHTAQAEAPGNTNLLWIDTGNGNILKFYDSESGTWKPVGAVWS